MLKLLCILASDMGHYVVSDNGRCGDRVAQQRTRDPQPITVVHNFPWDPHRTPPQRNDSCQPKNWQVLNNCTFHSLVFVILQVTVHKVV